MTNFITNTSDKKKKTALLLCLFGGIFGLHRFYVGKIGTGLIYMFTMGGMLFGVVIDLIKILVGSFRDNVGNPLRQ